MIELRLAKVIMVASLAALALLVTFGNLTDYGANFAFVQHVLSMDTIFPGDALRYRAITSPPLWHTAYALIIAAEAATGLAFGVGASALARKLRADAAGFNAAKRWTVIGATLAFLLWFMGFIVVGGEWFAMWQSATWNGQEAAFRIVMVVLGVLVFVSLPDGELG